MRFLDNLSSLLEVVGTKDKQSVTNEDINKLMQLSSIKIPDDYLSFLREINGLELESIELGYTLYLWSVQEIEFFYQDQGRILKMEKDTLIIGDDLGDLCLFYGNGNEGFGIYYSEMSGIFYQRAHKVCDSLTELLIEGKGLDHIFYN